MPRNTNPGNIKVGPGRDGRDRLALTVQTGPNFGLLVHVVPDYEPTTAPGAPQPADEPGAGGLYAHVHDGHPAEDISVEDLPGLNGGNLLDTLVQVAGDLPQEPPCVGQWHPWDVISGIPDWGVLKLADSSLSIRGLLTVPPAEDDACAYLFPYFWVPVSPALNNEFPGEGGADPQTDPLWNSGLGTGDLPGGGPGACFAGGFTRPEDGAGPVIRTDRILKKELVADPRTGYDVQAVTVSGIVYPADRGVLALVHLPAGAASWADFVAQPLYQKCVAALLLGQGIWASAEAGACDGQPGGIFGEDNPAGFPTRQAGQYHLGEIVAGSSGGIPLNSPFDDLDHDGVPGAKRFMGVPVPGPGQVRLGTDPDAGAPTMDYGIPVLGSDIFYYSPNNDWLYGWSYLVESNFFAYRLPCLDDYSRGTGLPYTPSGINRTAARETGRFFFGLTPAATGGDLLTAGNYPNFPEADWARQIGRFRHSFVLPATVDAGRNDIGTYWLIHFKTESEFERFMLDPAGGTYEVYNASGVGSADCLNPAVVNEETDPSVSPPAGPAPDYGYKGWAYHSVRANVLLDPEASTFVPDSNSCVWSCYWNEPDGDHLTAWLDPMFVSGVGYYTPRRSSTGSYGLFLATLNLNVPGFWGHSYRTADPALTLGAAPALLASLNPAFLGLASFAWGEGYNPDGSDRPYVLPAGFSDGDAYEHPQRVEFPFTKLGAYTEGLGPQITDPLTLSAENPIYFRGDPTDPAFTTDAHVRAYLRTPLGHEAVLTVAQPYSAAAGHGLDVALTPSTGAAGKILYHSSRFLPLDGQGVFGNYVDPGTGGPFADLHTAGKDSSERFLDEVYRWYAQFSAIPDADMQAALKGPGLPWSGGFIPIPVRVGLATLSLGWLNMGWHTHALTEAETINELQVVGLPDRNPPVTDITTAPFPSAGMLVYPSTDYQTGYRPNLADDVISQPDYSGCPALGTTRYYVRAFDASVGRPDAAEGSPFVTLRLDGIRLADFAYVAPGPGATTAGRGLAIEVKVPGLTTWMDIGRPDGDGPSKQDLERDGAGCRVVGPETFEALNPGTGFWYSQVKIHLGPVAALASCAYESLPRQTPLLVRVVMVGNANPVQGPMPYDLGHVFPSMAAATPGSSASTLRGLIEMQVIDSYPVT